MLTHVQCMTQFVVDPMPIAGSRQVELAAVGAPLGTFRGPQAQPLFVRRRMKH
jgi:hypothetical protein